MAVAAVATELQFAVQLVHIMAFMAHQHAAQTESMWLQFELALKVSVGHFG